MRAVVVDRLEGVSALALRDIAEPSAPGPGEAMVEILAVGLNYPDLLMLSGGYQFRPGLPFTPGMEAVGRCIALGEGLAADLLGARMIISARTGLLAERVTVPLAALRPAPDALDDLEAAAFTVGARTAHVALVQRGRLRRDEHLLVLGGGGGMGLAAVQLAKALGARVTALASTSEKRAAATAAGADQLLPMNRNAPDLAALKAQCDLVFDPVGGAAVLPALKTLRWGGRYLVVGFVAGPPVAVPLNLALLQGIAILGVRAGETARRDPAAGRDSLHMIDALAQAGRLAPHIGCVWPLDEAAHAFAAMGEGRLVGKAVIRIAD